MRLTRLFDVPILEKQDPDYYRGPNQAEECAVLLLRDARSQLPELPDRGPVQVLRPESLQE